MRLKPTLYLSLFRIHITVLDLLHFAAAATV